MSSDSEDTVRLTAYISVPAMPFVELNKDEERSRHRSTGLHMSKYRYSVHYKPRRGAIKGIKRYHRNLGLDIGLCT